MLDPWLFGWDTTPGIVSAFADRAGGATIWTRDGDFVAAHRDQYRPWCLSPHPAAKPAQTVELEGDNGLKFLVSGETQADVVSGLVTWQLDRGRKPLNPRDHRSYVTLSATEQYLMQSGRTHYKGMTFTQLHRLQFDLETTGLNAGSDRIFMIAIRDSTGFEEILEADDEAELIHGLLTIVRERDPDMIENHNLFGFDLPFLEARAKAHKVSLRLGREGAPAVVRRVAAGWRKRYAVGGRELMDTLDATWRMDFVLRTLKSHGLKAVARHFGLASDDREYIDGRDVHRTYLTDPDRVRKYALDDVREVDAISDRLHRSAFALAQMVPRRPGRIASGGTATGVLEPLLIRTYLREGQSIPNSDRAASEAHAGGAVRLFAAGLAHNVVKADVASLYPSLIRTYRIGPRSDSIGAFVHVVDRLTQRRLQHKELSANSEGAEQATHEGTQAALKLVINSAYGYLGAGRLALFADRAAADDITARARTLLGQICDQLELGGAQLIEADTDGVYFSVPDSWSEADRAALVTRVGETLPNGINLAHDGSFAAMYSHESKNYALLDYEGGLTIRGNALRGNRLEPFAARWLAETLEALLHCDLPAVRDAYLRQRDAIRERAVRHEDLATRETLTKTPQEYRESARKEPKYEAALLAGRSDWGTDERVAVYRADDLSWRLLDHSPTIPYNTPHYLEVLDKMTVRLSKAFAPEDFASLFRHAEQPSLFDRPVTDIETQLRRVVK